MTLVIFSANVINADQDDASATTDDATDNKLGSEDEIFLFILFLFFALCVSFFGSFLLYLSYLDDRIMKRYAEEGILLKGEVVTTEFTRGVDGDMTKLGDNNGQKEYFVSLEYSYNLSDNYPIRIRKQLRVLECDFCQADSCHDRKPNPVVEIIASRDSFFKSFQFDHGRTLELLVLPKHYLSALPACQVKRRLSTKYRLYSITFVVVAIIIAVFCFHLAAQEFGELVYGDEGNVERTILRAILVDLVFAIFALTPVPCIHFLLRDMILYSLEGEYFERGGHVLKGGEDDSSLSSRSDFGRTPSYFGYNRMGLETQSTLG